MSKSNTSTTSSSAARAHPRRQSAERPADPCTIDGGYTTVPATRLAALWCAFRDGKLGIADVRTWCALLSIEAGLRAAAQSGRGRAEERPTIDQVIAAYWGAEEREGAPHDRRVVRQRLNRLARFGLAVDVSTRPTDRAGRQRWTTSGQPDPSDVAEILLGFRCPTGRALRLPRRWVAGFAQQLTAGTFGLMVASAFTCGWGRGSVTAAGVERPAWSGRVSASTAASVLGMSARTLRAAITSMLTVGFLDPLPDQRWAARRWGRRVVIRPGPVVNVRRLAKRPARSARRRSAKTTASARRAAAPDQTQTRLRRIQTPRPAAAAGRGVCRQEAERPTKPQPTSRVRVRSQGTRQRGLWQDASITTLADTGRLYRRLVTGGVLADGPRDAVRFFAAAVRAREESRQPIALLRWLVGNGRWEFITDRQDEQGDREWKAWRRDADRDPAAEWDNGEETAAVRREPANRAINRGTRRNTKRPTYRQDPHAALPQVRVATVQVTKPTPAAEEFGDTVDQWPADVRVLVGQRAMGRARGWDEASIDQRLAKRDGWTEVRVRQAASAARERGLLEGAESEA